MTLTHWNPSTPAKIGLEYWPDLGPETKRSFSTTSSKAFRQVMRSEGADTVTGIELWRTVVAPSGARGVWCAEVYELGDELDATSSWSAWTAYVPNAALSNGGWTAQNGASSVVDAVDTDPGGDGRAAEYLLSPPSGSGSVQFQFGSGAASLNSRIQIRLRMKYVGRPSITFVSNTTGRVWSNATAPWYPDDGRIDPKETVIDFPEINPNTGLPWTQADVRAFDADYRIVVSGTGVTTRIYYLGLEVRSAIDNRVAIAIGDVLETESNTVSSLPLAASWAKADATSYAVVIRPLFLGVAGYVGGTALISGFGSTANLQPATPVVHYLSGPDEPSATDFDVSIASINGAGRDEYGIITATDDGTATTIGACARIVWETAGADTDDGTPYCRVFEYPVGGGITGWQEFSAPASDTYDAVAFLCNLSDGTPNANLTVQIRRDSDNVVFASGVVTPADVAAAPLWGTSPLWRVVRCTLTDSLTALSNATDYHIFWSSTSTNPYNLQLLGTDPTSGGGHTLSTFEGDESFESNFLGDMNSFDAAAYVYIAPDPPAGFAATGGSVPAGWESTQIERVDPMRCPPTIVPVIELGWTATSLSSVFTAYRIQRRDTADPVWRTIAVITSESVEAFDDYEARVRVGTDYRIRVEGTGGVSQWVSASAMTITDRACLLFTTNADQTVVVATADMYSGDAEQFYEFTEGSAERVMEIHGRDMPLVFQPAERSGARFERDVLIDVVDADRVTAGPGAYSTLRDLAKNITLGYVCVRDHAGNRWFGSVLVPEINPVTVDAALSMLFCRVRVIETTVTPVVVDVVP